MHHGECIPIPIPPKMEPLLTIIIHASTLPTFCSLKYTWWNKALELGAIILMFYGALCNVINVGTCKLWILLLTPK
jgi:hypothetical protein